MLSSDPSLPEALHVRLLTTLDRLIKQRYGNFKRAEEATGVRRITLRQWRRGSRRPSLHRILRTIDQLGFTFLEVIRAAELFPELQRDPSLQLAAALPRQHPQDPVLAGVLSQASWKKLHTGVACEIPATFKRLELHLDRDVRVARVEFQEYLQRAESQEDRASALCLWAISLNSQGAAIDAGLAVRAALERLTPTCPLYFLLLNVSASVAKNLHALEVGRAHSEQAILGFLRVGDSENAARGLLTLGIILWALEDFDESERAYRDALRLSPGSRFASMCQFNLIYNYLATEKIDAALRAVENHRESLAAIPPAHFLKAHWLSAKVLVASNRHEAAVAELQIALRSARLLDENPQTVFQMFFELAELLAKMGRSIELRSIGQRLIPLLAFCDDSDDSVAISRAFLRSIQSGFMTERDVQDFVRRFETACERSSSSDS